MLLSSEPLVITHVPQPFIAYGSLRVGGIIAESITDGPGLRYVVFTQGCPHNCRGCHNPETHNPTGGYTIEIREILSQCDANPLLAGVTFSGGEPFLQPAPLAVLAKQLKAKGKNIVVYTGYTFETLQSNSRQNPDISRLLELTDLLVDGPYIEALRDISLPFRGSSNQRILDRIAMQNLL